MTNKDANKKTWEEIEELTLAPYAQKTINSQGRKFKEEEHPFRSPYQRDRDRIVYSPAFRRLEYKTQVFVSYKGDHYRTRLTHTIEVAGISRTIARTLRLNEDLTEAIALAHDIGHSPFGHSGEDTLNKLMKNDGGFNHNVQSLRIVEKLAQKYPTFSGLNLTYEVKRGLMKHKHDIRNADYEKDPNLDLKTTILEAHIADLADEIAYNSHDMDDALEYGMLTEKDLEHIAIWKETYQQIKKEFPLISKRMQRLYTIRTIIDTVVTDLLITSLKQIEKLNIQSQEDVLNSQEDIICFSPEIAQMNKELKKFLLANFYEHPAILKKKKEGQEILEFLFEIHLKDPSLFLKNPDKIQNMRRVVCDYIAGMTDRFVYQEYERLKDIG